MLGSELRGRLDVVSADLDRLASVRCLCFCRHVKELILLLINILVHVRNSGCRSRVKKMARHISTTLSSRIICTLRLILLIPVRVLGLSLSFVCCIATRQHPGCVSLRGSGACIARSALLATSPLAIVCPFSGSDLVWTEHALDIRLRVTRAAHLPNLALTVCRHSCRLSRDERVFLLHYFVF